MTTITRGTAVTFPRGELSGKSRILAVERHGDYLAVITESTPFHPVDHRWPDQPGDLGRLEADGQRFDVLDCLTGAVAAYDGEIRIDSDITARRGEAGWGFVVVHIVGSAPAIGQDAVLTVDADRRRELSASHTACHLSGLALNEALADFWSKPVGLDSLGRPDFDGAALAESRITEKGFHDVYRIGRSLRRAGFSHSALAETVGGLGERLTDDVQEWIRTAAPVRIETEGDLLADRRTWVCPLLAGEARLPCGGTHPDSLTALESVVLTAELAGDRATLTVRGEVTTRVDEGNEHAVSP